MKLTCCTCKSEKECEEFSKNSSTKTGYQSRCKDCVKAHYKKFPDKVKALAKEKYHTNKQDPTWLAKESLRKTKQSRVAYKQNPEKFKLKSKNFKANNKHRYAEYQSLRSRNISYQTKKLSEDDRAKLQFIYLIRAALSDVTHQVWHVDHIVPLKGKGICGLHVPWNLTLLTAHENCSKSNKTITAFESERL